MVDFISTARTMLLAGPEDRALLGSNPSAAAGDGDSGRGFSLTAAPASQALFPGCPCPKSDKPLTLRIDSTEPKTRPVNRPVCHMAISSALITFRRL